MPIHFDTPKKYKIKGAIAWAEHQAEVSGVPFHYHDIASFFGIYRNSVTKLKNTSLDRTFHSDYLETRGQKRKLSHSNYSQIVQLYKDHPNKAVFLPWTGQAISALDIEISS